jgi:hypothetical protein
MTMLAYYIKPVLELVPEALPMVKLASLTGELPTDGRSSTLASALAITYMTKVAHVPVAYEDLEKVAKAVSMYSLQDEVNSLKSTLVKRAGLRAENDAIDSGDSYLLKQAYFEGELSGFSDIAYSVKEATSLYKQASEKGIKPSEELIRYSGHGFLNKEAALRSLSLRYSLSKDHEFIKLAKALGNTPDEKLTPELVSVFCDKVTEMDKTAGLALRGFNFYKETILTKESELKSVLSVNVAGTKVPYEKLEQLGKARISQYIGADVAKEMDAGPGNFKQVVETLPRDLQQVLLNLTRNV